MKGSLRHIILELLILSLVVSCGAPKAVTVERVNNVGEHMRANNLLALIADMKEWPAYKSEIRDYLLQVCDYSQDTYVSLKRLYEASEDDWELSEFYDSLMTVHQQAVFDTIATMSLAEIGKFYDKNYNTEPYLFDAVKTAFFADVDSLDYYSIRNLYKAFGSTRLAYIVRPRYLALRSELMQSVNSDLRNYFDAEDKLLENEYLAAKDEIQPHIQQAVANVVDKALIKLDRGLFKRTFKRDKDIDKYNFTELLSKTFKESIDTIFIKRCLLKHCDDFVRASNTLRKEYLVEYLPDGPSRLEAPDVKLLFVPIWKDPACYLDFPPVEDYVNGMQLIKDFSLGLTLVSTAVSFIPGIGWVSAAVDVLDLCNGLAEDSMLRDEVDSIAVALTDLSFSTIDAYASTVFGSTEAKRAETEKLIIDKINAEF